MDPEQLLEEWMSGEQSGMRAQRIQSVREDLMDATGEYIPRRISEIEALILQSPQQKAVITRKLRDAVHGETEGGDNGADSDSTDAAE